MLCAKELVRTEKARVTKMVMYMHAIRPGLLLGELTSLRYVQQKEITHVLSVTKDAPLISEMYPDGGQKQRIIQVDDVSTEDLLPHFQECIDFIKQALKERGKVLVHCIAGVSRSPTVVMAYLMQVEGMDAATAIATVTSLRHVVSPNSGFLEQLGMWEEMGAEYDPTHASVKRKAVQSLQERQVAGAAIEKQDLAEVKSGSKDDKGVLYRCRICRTLVATSGNEAQEYLVKQANSADPKFNNKRTNGKAAGQMASSAQTQIFVEPMQWMEEVLGGSIQGKLYCKGCQARIGSFNWSGMQNSKGDWVTPAFELQLSKLDALPSNPTSTQIRKPVL